MASRMDRYHNDSKIVSNRSSKNKSLYKQIEDLDSYTNIEGVATIEKTNEIDISKVKEMIKNREAYKKQKQYSDIVKKEIETEPLVESPIMQEKNYDINELLAKISQEKYSEKYRSLDKEQYEALKQLNKKNKRYDIEKEESEIRELINTITSDKELNELKDLDDVGLLDELKSNTMVGDASSIKKILEEEKKNSMEEDSELDKSFYTSSFGFTSTDFEELKNINHKIKKDNKFIIILLVIIIALIIVGCIIFVMK